jgi:hypothetical protein
MTVKEREVHPALLSFFVITVVLEQLVVAQYIAPIDIAHT